MLRRRDGNVLVYLLIGVLAASVLGLTGDQILQSVYDSTNTAFRANIVAGSAGGSPSGSVGNLQTKASSSAFGTYGGATCSAGNAIRVLDASGAATCISVSSGSVTGTGTTGVIPKWTSSSAIGDGALVDNATSVVSIATAGRGSQLANASVTGTTANKLAKQSSTGALIVATSDTGGVLGICDTGCGTTGSASIIDSGPASCVFDNSVVKGDLFSLSTSVAGDCTDIGVSTTGGVPILGIVTNANAAAGTRTVWFNGPDVANITNVKGGSGGSGNTTLRFPVTVSGTTTSGGVPYFSSTTVLSSSALLSSNVLVKGGGAGAAPTTSSITDNGTTVSTSEALSVGALTYNGKLTISDINADSSNFTVAHRVHYVTTGASTITATTPASPSTGDTYTVVKADSGAGTVVWTRAGSQTLNGATTRTVSAQYKSDTCVYMASNVWICQGDGA